MTPKDWPGKPFDCRHRSATARCCLICQVLPTRHRPNHHSLLPRGGREGSTIASRLELVRRALDAALQAQLARLRS